MLMQYENAYKLLFRSQTVRKWHIPTYSAGNEPLLFRALFGALKIKDILIIGLPVRTKETLMMNEDQVNDIVKRWRGTPEEDLKPEDYQQFKDLGCACLTQGNSKLLLKFVQDMKNQDIVKWMGCVLLAPLVNEVVKKDKSLDHCQAAITHLTRTCSPDELLHSLLELIEDIDPYVISETIIALVPHLLTVLLRLDERKAASVGLALSGLQKQLSRLPVPYTQQQEEADEYGVCRCCTALAELTKPFIEEVKRNEGNCATTTEDEELKAELLKFCMRSLREPLLEAELTRHRKSSLWLFATEIMVTLPAIQESLSELLFFSSLKKPPLMDNSESRESRACIAYLLFVQLVTIDSFPAVFRCMLKTSNHSGLEGYIVKNIRNQVGFSLKPGNANKWFLGVELLSLLGLALCLPQGSETDLLHNMDRIMECLNLLRYILIRNKELRSNNNMWEELCGIKDQYVKMLRVCISISRAYYSAELKALKEDQKLKAKEARASARSTKLLRSITRKHEKASTMSPDVQHQDRSTKRTCRMSQVLQSALVTFDLMESLIFRIEEITEE
ncbi:hypothetical protein PAMA_001825 [Pampus argenteus]